MMAIELVDVNPSENLRVANTFAQHDANFASGLALLTAYATTYPGAQGREEEEIQYMQAAILALLLRKFDSR